MAQIDFLGFLGKWKAVEENWKAAEENWKAAAESRKGLWKVEGQMVGMVEWREWRTEWSNGRQKWLHTYYLRYTHTDDDDDDDDAL